MIEKTATSTLSFAKINLSLEILGRRSDGYHEICTVFQALDLADELTFDWETVKTELVCANREVPQDESNLVLRAIKAIEKRTDSSFNVKVTLNKKIPMGAGLGGGSSNAATMLVEAGRKLGLSSQVLHEIASSLGADVSFFLRGGTVLGKGRGERLEELPKLPKMPVVIVMPPFAISTAEAYGKVTRYSSGERTERLSGAIKKKRFDRIFDYFANDFEEALFPSFPRLAEIKKTFICHGALAAQLSGSGSALFAFARNAVHAEELAASVRPLGETWITST